MKEQKRQILVLPLFRGIPKILFGCSVMLFFLEIIFSGNCYARDTVRTFYKNGSLKTEKITLSSKKYLLKKYDPDEWLVEESEYVDNAKEGESIEYRFGVIETIGFYKKGKLNGSFRVYDNDGYLIKAEDYKDGIIYLNGYSFFNVGENDETVDLNIELMDTTLFNEKTRKLKEHRLYSKGNLESWVEYYPSGSFKEVGQKLGGSSKFIKKRYSKEGKLTYRYTYDGTMYDGLCIDYTYDDQDSIEQYRTESYYKKNKLNGTLRVFYYGIPYQEKNYKDDVLDGISKEFYKESGGIRYIDTYKKGVKINRKMYSEEGKLEFDQDYPN